MRISGEGAVWLVWENGKPIAQVARRPRKYSEVM